MATVEHMYDHGRMNSRNAGYGDPNLRYTTGPKITDEEIVSIADTRPDAGKAELVTLLTKFWTATNECDLLHTRCCVRV